MKCDCDCYVGGPGGLGLFAENRRLLKEVVEVWKSTITESDLKYVQQAAAGAAEGRGSERETCTGRRLTPFLLPRPVPSADA